MKVHEAIAAALREQQIDVVFGLVGDANLYMMNSFRSAGGSFVPVANESGALLAAAGYAAVSGRFAVATVTHGPGLANTVNSLYEAVKHRVPALLIAGDTARTDGDNFQDIDQRALVTATGAEFIEARSPGLATTDLVRAIRTAVRRRLPVVFNVPIDYQWVDVDEVRHPLVALSTGTVPPDPERIEEAVGVLAAARRPLILAGRGAIGARVELVALAERLGAPLATTAQARQLFRGEPADLGIFGGLATAEGLQAMLEADCILAFGASLNTSTTSRGSLVEGRRVVHIDVEPAAIGRHVEPAVGVVADAAAAASALLALVDEAELPVATFASVAAEHVAGAAAEAPDRLTALRAKERTREIEGTRPAGTVDLALALRSLDGAFPADRNLVIDAGRFCITALAVMTVEDPARYVHTINFASIGVGVPYAIGAALGDPTRPTLLVCGDGGFMLGGLTEFNTAVRLGLDLTVAVVNDGSFGAEHIQLVRKGIDPTISTFEWPDLADVALSLGGAGITVRSLDELDAALAHPGGRPGPTLLNILVSADEISGVG